MTAELDVAAVDEQHLLRVIFLHPYDGLANALRVADADAVKRWEAYVRTCEMLDRPAGDVEDRDGTPPPGWQRAFNPEAMPFSVEMDRAEPRQAMSGPGRR